MTQKSQISVNSLWLNIERLLSHRISPAWAQLSLGVCWSAGEIRSGMSEYAWPVPDFAARLQRRSGVAITAWSERGAANLWAHLTRGEPAVAAVDSYYLPYRPAFGRVHSGRTVILRQDPDSADQVLIEDYWPPQWRGSVPVYVLESARWSDVPLDWAREPVFAGVPINGDWWCVELPPIPDQPDLWLRARLAELWGDACGPTRDRCLPAEALERLAFRLSRPALEPLTLYRDAALYLRALLSARAYVLALTGTAADILRDTLLESETRRYAIGLAALVEGRDLLIKSLAFSRSLYARLIDDCLHIGADAERHLTAALEAYCLYGPEASSRA
jgi:hypothetical protein